MDPGEFCPAAPNEGVRMVEPCRACLPPIEWAISATSVLKLELALSCDFIRVNSRPMPSRGTVSGGQISDDSLPNACREFSFQYNTG